MDRESILSLKAGPEMDALVAECVMGWKRDVVGTHERSLVWRLPSGGWTDHVPKYSATWDGVRLVAEDVGEQYLIEIIYHGSRGCCVSLARTRRDEDDITCEGKALPETLCRAALLAAWEDSQGDRGANSSRR